MEALDSLFNGQITWEDLGRGALELFIVIVLIYQFFRLMRGSRSTYILVGILVGFLALRGIAQSLKFKVILEFTRQLTTAYVVLLAVIFQPEFRRAFARLGGYFSRRSQLQREVNGEIVKAVTEMAQEHCGALIVLERKMGFSTRDMDAVQLDCKVNAQLLKAIFSHHSPLHDGAVIINGNRITAAKVILPMPQGKTNLPARVGTRHRAALGASQVSDAVVLVVSEERGVIGMAVDGNLRLGLRKEELFDVLEKLNLGAALPEEGRRGEGVRKPAGDGGKP